jgi:hypothetical protein
MKRFFRSPLAVLLVLGGLMSFVSMPGETYMGDPGASMEEAFQLVNQGHFWIPLQNVRIMQSEKDEGQYYAKNERTGRFYSKYGVACTLILVPPVMAYNWGLRLGVRDGNWLWLTILNFYYWGFTLLLLALLYWAARPFAASGWIATLWTLAIVYGSFLWHYTRGQSMELFQVAGCVALFLCARKAYASAPLAGWGARFAAAVLRLRQGDSSQLRARRWEWACWALIWVLALFKVFNLVLALPLLAFLWRRDWKLRDWFFRWAVPCGVLGLAMGAIFTVRFGAPWLTGYHQWQAEADRFVGSLWVGVTGFLFNQQKSIFTHFPPFLIGLFGVRSFSRRNPREFAFGMGALVVSLLITAKMPTWRGDSCYGPRYLLYYLPIASLPMVSVLNWIQQEWKRMRPQAGSAAVVLALLLFASASAQLEVNRQPFFQYWTLWNKVGFIRDPELDSYIRHRMFPLFYREARRGLLHGQEWIVLEKIRDLLPPDQAAQVRTELVNQVSRRNYYWF